MVKTKKNIKESFIFLLENKSFKDITIQNIIDTALINRSTFYKYYKDKYDLAEQLSDEYIQQAKSYLKDRFKETKDQDLTYVVKKLCSFNSAEILYIILMENRDGYNQCIQGL